MKKTAMAVWILQGALLAHTGDGTTAGMMAGFAHPIAGADHILAMIAVGLWAVQTGGRALWAVPLSFVIMMAAGAVMGIQGIQVPLIEAGILASVVVLGGLIAFGTRMPVLLGSAVVGVFAMFHGAAHGAEMPLNAGGIGYGAGFILSTGMLHIAGIALGMAIYRLSETKASRVAGGAIAVSGIALVLS